MRIAYINADYGVPVLGRKGSSVHVKEMVNAFTRLGNDVDLFYTRLGHGEAPPLARLIGAEGVAVQPTESTGIPAEKRERHRKERGWIASARATEEDVIRCHAGSPFDLIYERYSLWSRAGANAAAKLNIPYVLEVNAPLVDEAAEYRDLADVEFARDIERAAFSAATLVVAVSDSIRSYVRSIGVPDHRIATMANGVNIDAFHPDAEPARLQGLGEGPVIGFVGGLKHWHGVSDLMNAFRVVRRHMTDAQLLIVGDGPKRGWVEGFANGAGLEDCVHLTGWQPHGSLPSYVARMDITVAPYPSSERFYFSPLKLFEYMAAGKPVVASRIGQICSVVDEGRTGILVPPGDSKQLAREIANLAYDAPRRKAMGQEARAAAAKRSWLGNAQRVLGFVADARATTAA